MAGGIHVIPKLNSKHQETQKRKGGKTFQASGAKLWNIPLDIPKKYPIGFFKSSVKMLFSYELLTFLVGHI